MMNERKTERAENMGPIANAIGNDPDFKVIVESTKPSGTPIAVVKSDRGFYAVRMERSGICILGRNITKKAAMTVFTRWEKGE